MAEIRQQRDLGFRAVHRRVRGHPQRRLRAGRPGARRGRLQHRLHGRLRLPGRAGPGTAASRRPTAASPRCPAQGGYGSFGPLTQAMYEARHQAIGRMIDRVRRTGRPRHRGVSLTIGSFPAGGLEFKAIGTAVRAPGAPPLAQPFTSDLSGQDFAKLMHGRLGAGRAGARHLGRRPARRLADRRADPLGRGQRRGARLHRAGERSRHDARQRAGTGRAAGSAARASWCTDGHAGARAGVPDAGARQGSRRGSDHHRHGHGAVRAPRRKPPPPLAILSLDPQRRQAARVRLGPLTIGAR